MFLIKGLFMLAIIAIILLMLAPVIIKSAISRMIGKATNQQQQQYSNPFGGSQSQSSYSSTQADDVEEYHGSVLVHDEDSARRMRRMKADAEDVEAVIIDEPAKVREEEKVYR